MGIIDIAVGLNRSIWNAPDLEPLYPPAPPGTDDEELLKKYKIDLEKYTSQYKINKNRHAEISATIRRVFYAILSTSLFSVAVLFGGADSNIISASSNVTLPILNYKLTYVIFLSVGPIVVLALTAYLHIFIEEHRRLVIDSQDRIAALFNMEGNSAKIVSWLLFYWIPPITLAFFTWEAWPLEIERKLLLFATISTTVTLIALQIRRTNRKFRSRLAFATIAIATLSLISFYKMASEKTFDLDGIEITDRDLRMASLGHAHMNGAILTDINLNGVDLTGAHLSGAQFFSVDFRNADLSGALLNGAMFKDSLLANATLNNANLEGADLQTVNDLKPGQLDNACGDDKTRLPDVFADRLQEIQLMPCVTHVPLGTLFDSEIGIPDGMARYTFTIERLGNYQIDVTSEDPILSSQFDPIIEISGRDLSHVLEDNDGGTGSNSRIVTRLKPGDYQLVVREHGGSHGAFFIKVGEWDRRWFLGSDEFTVPSEATDDNTIMVNSETLSDSLLVQLGAENHFAWIDVNNPDGRSIQIDANSQEDRGIAIYLFDPIAALAPLALDEGTDSLRSVQIQCSMGLSRYILLVTMANSPTAVDVSVELQNDGKASVVSDCTAS